MTCETDVLIAGGGFAGLTLAIALRQALGPSFAVTVADPALGKSHADDERASAIVAAARHTHNAMGILLLNLFLGWTMIGWFVALVMAFSSLPAYPYDWYHHRGW